MRQSQLFTKTRKEAPSDEISKNAELLIRAGFIHKEMAGVYSYLPLGLRTLKKIEQIVREEMNAIGAIELELSALQNKELWEKTDRWDDSKVDNWFKTKLKNDSELGLGFTHEEPLTNILKDHISSYKDLPVYIYQFQTKFRNELRAKSGILRGREFLMKDLYSFSKDETEHAKFYEKMKDVYLKIFNRIGIGEDVYLTFASGGSFSKYSHEFQLLTEAGEDTIYINTEKKMGVNKEVYNDEVLAEISLDKNSLKEMTSVEVGNIFNLGTKFSEPLGLMYANADGERKPVIMGSYGIGIGRLMGAVAEKNSSLDERGGFKMNWPEEIAPYKVHLICASSDDESVRGKADQAYKALCDANIEVLYDDRQIRAGEKFADADLIGIPHRIVVGKKSAEEGLIEHTFNGQTDNISHEEVIKRLT